MSRISFGMLEAGVIPGDLGAFKKEGGKIRLYDSGGAPSQPTDQRVTQTTIPEYAQPYVEKMLGKTEALTQTPYQPYKGERIAGFTPLQQQAFGGIGSMQVAPQVGGASQMAGLAGLGSLMAGQRYAQQATDPYSMQAYMSPYVESALAPQLREAARQSAMQGQQAQAQAVQQGAFGGARSAIVEAERQRNLGQLQSDIYSRGLQSAFEQARQAQQFGSTLGLQGLGQAGQLAGTLGQLGTQQFAQQKDILQGQLAAGEQQRALEQQRLAQQYEDFQAQRQYPYQQLAFMSDMLRGLPLSQYTQTMYQQPTSPLATVAGLGMTALGAQRSGYFADGGLTGLALYNMSRG